MCFVYSVDDFRLKYIILFIFSEHIQKIVRKNDIFELFFFHINIL